MRLTFHHIYFHTWKKKLTKLQHQLDIDEQILLTRLAQGDSTAFWQLWMRYQKYIYYRCYRLMRHNYDDTEYAFNQVMLKIWHRLPNAAAKITHPKAWVSRAVNDICLEIRQERQRIAQCIDSFGVDEETTSIEFLNDLQKPSHHAIACSEWEKYIYLALDRFSSPET